MRIPGGPNPIRRRGGKTLRQAIQRRLLKEDIKGLINQALQQSAQDAIPVAIKFSSGTVDSAKEGRPYSKARPNPAFDPAQINVGKGKKRHPGVRFAAGWRLLPPTQGIGIYNISPIGPYLEQLRGGSARGRMVPRPVDRLIISALDPIVRRNLDKAFSADGTLSLPATRSLAAQ